MGRFYAYFFHNEGFFITQKTVEWVSKFGTRLRVMILVCEDFELVFSHYLCLSEKKDVLI